MTLTFLALGDSYTSGEAIDPTDCWPMHLARLLRAEGTAIADPHIVARPGWTTDELDDAIAAARVSGTWSMVSLLIGVNNQYRSRAPDAYRAEFRGLLRKAVAFAGRRASRVLVLSIPDWSVMPVAEGRDRARIAREIDAFNAVAHDEAVRAGVRWVDVTPASRDMRDGWAAADGLHPSGAQYAAWAALTLEPARAILGGR